MSRSARPLTPAGRDAGLRRLRTFNRVLVGLAVAGTGLLTDVAAQAFPGHKRVVRPPAAAQSPRAAVADHLGPSRRRHHSHAAHRALKAPAQAPTTSSSSTQQATSPAPQATTPAPQATSPAPQATVPQPQSAPAPVVSGGS